MSFLLSGNQSGVQQSILLTAFAAPVVAFIRATLQPVPKEFATPHNHWPSGDQVVCWKNPLRGSVCETLPLARSTNATPLILKVAISRPFGLQVAHGSSPSP